MTLQATLWQPWPLIFFVILVPSFLSLTLRGGAVDSCDRRQAVHVRRLQLPGRRALQLGAPVRPGWEPVVVAATSRPAAPRPPPRRRLRARPHRLHLRRHQVSLLVDVESGGLRVAPGVRGLWCRFFYHFIVHWNSWWGMKAAMENSDCHTLRFYFYFR